jgi:hypothetical protein
MGLVAEHLQSAGSIVARLHIILAALEHLLHDLQAQRIVVNDKHLETCCCTYGRFRRLLEP